MLYVIRSTGGFLDGNIIPRRISPGEVLEVDESTYRKLNQSDPDGWELVEKRVPPSVLLTQPDPVLINTEPAARGRRGR